jgi:hypothetical protein
MKQERVGMLNFNTVWGKALWREVFKVEGDYDVCAGADGGRDHMTVPPIGELDAGYEPFISSDLGARERCIHQSAGAGKLLGLNIRPVFQHVSRPLIMDLVGPPSAIKPRCR